MRILFLILALSFSCFGQTAAVSLPLGNPSNAVADQSSADNYLVGHTGFVLSYNRSRGGYYYINSSGKKTYVKKELCN